MIELLIIFIIVPLLIAEIIIFLQDKLKFKFIIPILIGIVLINTYFKTKTCSGGTFESIGCAAFYGFGIFYLIIALIISIVCLYKTSGILIAFKDIGKKPKEIFENKMPENKKFLHNSNYDIYYLKKDMYGKIYGCLVIDKKSDDTCEIDVVDLDNRNILKKNRKFELILEKLKELGYKKIIVDKENYDYLKESLNYYNIKSIEDEDSYVLEI